MVNIREDEADSPFSSGVVNLKERYSLYNLDIRDVSSGINTRFLGTELLEKESIKRLVQTADERYLVRYGWAHADIMGEKVRTDMIDSFGISDTEDLFPLINRFQMTNIHYLSRECIEAFLDACEIKDGQEKAYALFTKSRTEPVTHIGAVLGVREGHRILKILGYKTTFWEVTFRYKEYRVRGVFCGVPDRQKPDVIDHYRILERNLIYHPE